VEPEYRNDKKKNGWVGRLSSVNETRGPEKADRMREETTITVSKDASSPMSPDDENWLAKMMETSFRGIHAGNRNKTLGKKVRDLATGLEKRKEWGERKPAYPCGREERM